LVTSRVNLIWQVIAPTFGDRGVHQFASPYAYLRLGFFIRPLLVVKNERENISARP
jgi:hypothetical protein